MSTRNDDVALLDEEVQFEVDAVHALLRTIETPLPSEAKLDKLSKAKDLLTTAQKNLNRMRHEIRVMENEGAMSAYEAKARQHNSTIQSLKVTVSDKRAALLAKTKSSEERPEPTAARSTTVDEDPRRKAAKASATRTLGYQDSTIKSLDITAKLIEDSERQADDAVVTLAKNHDQIAATSRQLDHIEGQVKSANKELNAFIRRMMTDKIIICFALLIVIGIIVIVVLKITHPGEDGVLPTITPTPTPIASSFPVPLPPSPAPLRE